jgi:phenylacetate-coenzyme A ligase PaaK-like adenylate-forming protein
MQSLNSFKSKIFEINNQNFAEHALGLFYYQAEYNTIYRQYLKVLGCNAREIKQVEDIPFLPISFFKYHDVRTGIFNAEVIYESSGTTGTLVSRHAVDDTQYYFQVAEAAFSSYFGSLDGKVVIGLLPSYLERNTSSLVAMVSHFIRQSGHVNSGFYLRDFERLHRLLKKLTKQNVGVVLFGVTFALLDFAREYLVDVPGLTLFETGGMKGRGKELTRDELQQELRRSFRNCTISSEYGMTELLSQAYLLDDGYFHAPPWMKILVRDMYDPFARVATGKHGGVNIIDLANAHSCAFIETEDIGISNGTGFKVLGRMDNSDIRGCNLLI